MHGNNKWSLSFWQNFIPKSGLLSLKVAEASSEVAAAKFSGETVVRWRLDLHRLKRAQHVYCRSLKRPVLSCCKFLLHVRRAVYDSMAVGYGQGISNKQTAYMYLLQLCRVEFEAILSIFYLLVYLASGNATNSSVSHFSHLHEPMIYWVIDHLLTTHPTLYSWATS